MSRRRKQVELALREYEVTLTRILPRAVREQWESLAEEIDHLLFTRSQLQGDFEQYGVDGVMRSVLERVQELDRVLLEHRELILMRESYVHEMRKRRHIPDQHWWWYLDELESAKLPEWVVAESKRS